MFGEGSTLVFGCKVHVWVCDCAYWNVQLYFFFFIFSVVNIGVMVSGGNDE